VSQQETLPTRHAVRRTLGADLERDRLRERATRLDRVVAALRARARAYDESAVPPALSLSLTDFQLELAAVRERLAAR
jgi:hypothetical protein